MLIGHVAAGLAAKKLAPKTSAGTLVASAQAIDLLWPALLLIGVERVKIAPHDTVLTHLAFEHYPISHSLLAVIGWGLLIGGIYYLIKRRTVAALTVGALVVSHWFLDLLVHRPDLPRTPWGATMVGFGLWNVPIATFIIEGGLFAAGVAIYARMTRSRDRVGTWGLWTLLGLLVLIYIANFTSPPPPSTAMVAVGGFGQWLFVLWFAWVDRHRSVVS